MAEQTVTFRLKATNEASAELAKVADEMRRLNHEAVTSRAGVASWGTAWGTASETVKSGAKGAADGIGTLDNAAKNAAQGGLRELTGGVPILDTALGKLTNTLGGFPLLLTGVVGAGVGVVKMLSDMSAEASKANTDIAAVSKTIETDLQQSILNIAKIRAGGAGDAAGAARLGAAAEIKALTDARDAAVTAAKKKLDETPDVRGLGLSPVTQAKMMAERLIAEGKYAVESGKAEETLALKKFEINQRLKFDLKKLDDDRLADEKKNRDEAVKNEEEAAKQIADATKASTSSVLGVFKDLGAGFEETTKRLGLNEFVQKQKEAMAELEKGLKLGTVTQAQYEEGTAALTKRMQEAITLGYVPTVEAAKKVTEAVAVAAEATKTASDSIAASLFNIGAASADTIATLDALIAKGAAIQAAAGGGAGAAGGAGSAVRPEAGGATGAGGTGVYGGAYGGSVLGGIVNQPKGSGLTPLTGGASQYYDLGGVSHPSIRDAGPGQNLNPNPASAAGYRNQPTVQTINLTVNQSGTVVSNDRDWATVGASVASGAWNAY